MPQTVPNRPTKGAVEPMVARTPVPRDIRRPAWVSIRDSAEETRSLMPPPSVCSTTASESCISWVAIRNISAAGPPFFSTASVASFKVFALRMTLSVAPARTRAPASSIDFATQTVQVTSDAKARPIITPFTTQSAAMNMPHGDRLCGISARCSALAGAALTGSIGGAASFGAAVWFVCAGCGAVSVAGCVGAGWACAGSVDEGCDGALAAGCSGAVAEG
ncbi:hypothetical protein D3C86_1622860 [compost metagenome]